LNKIKIIEASNKEDFEKELNSKLSEGWELYQGMEVTSIFRNDKKNAFPYESKSFYQMVIKVEKK
jgi:hypothetical protein